MAVVRKGLDWLIKELAEAALEPAKQPVAALVLATSLFAASLWTSYGREFFLRQHRFPGWAMSALFWLLLGLLALLWRQRVQISRLTPRRRLTRFLWRGLEWVLTDDFWANYEVFLADDLGAPGGAVRGPFCPSCGHDVQRVIFTSNQCSFCPGSPAKFDLTDLQTYRTQKAYADLMDHLQRDVYRRAQAAARTRHLCP